MKRFLLILVTMLLLAGCSKLVPPDPTAPAPTGSNPTTQPTTLPALYVPESTLEKQTGGAVRVYDLKSAGWFSLSGLGSDVLLVGADKMQVLTGEQGMISAQITAEGVDSLTETDVAASGVACYIPASRSVILRNPQLQITAQRDLPDTLVGRPVIDLLRNEVYYITDSEIRAMNLSTGVSRLLRQQTGVAELLPDTWFEGSVLACRVQNAAGQQYTEYLSAVTGQTLEEENGILEMATCEDRYFIRHRDGRLERLLFGTRKGETKNLSATGTAFQALKMNGVITCETSWSGVALSFIDLNTGKRTAQTQLSGVKELASVYCDGTYIWLLAKEDESQRLLRWDISKSAAQDDKDYSSPFYTAESPDTEGINACKTLADTYAQKYGVKINIWKDATVTTGGYTVTEEYQPETIRAMLEELEPMLEIFPENFLLKTVEAGWIRINLVRQIDGGKSWAHFWEGKDCHILISGEGYAGEWFLRGLAYAVDSHILGNSRDVDFDRWNPLNPADFAYSDAPVKPEYLAGETRAFANEQAATSILEDRCSIFYNAIIGGNTELFKAPIMQAKLQRLCMGIREAYGLQKSEKAYLWERYLETPLAYKK